eukprot:Gregarina_sp_Poly_1__10946@NODE_860_length_5945_cov_36_349779_g622_i0_p1_GENE_NODE_860_length_5945_cov_36_349779_g622_i0NODE_860_length_5945_cov_36_349779_g622_i0_p1_ORF_typecomplete_len427_score54_65SlyX/PF04102_12/0_0039SlyX/PF04102_12/5_8e03CEP209_CC5/PF16574_5/0_0083GAS/PF13851_6/0_011HrpB7/PF09486_10/0_014HrpB7/PF09486_10/3_3e03HAP1_N/PF04849_13/0_027FliJ/PF02050_16/0_021RasGAP_C/PF03836_15/0_039CENPF_N/PF10481_9/0_044HOOK/PF05622_12/0_039SHE3/PF17078_5/0_071Atg14/PF10186_9/0_093Tropomyosin
MMMFIVCKDCSFFGLFQNWIKDLSGRVSRQENQISALEQEIVNRRFEFEKCQQQNKRLQSKLDTYESSFQSFSCYQVNVFQRTPVTLSLYQSPQTGAFCCYIQKWESRQLLRSYDIHSVSVANIASTSIGKWSFRGVSGRILEWWGSDLLFVDESAVSKRTAFWGNYAYDHISTDANTGPGCTRVLVVDTNHAGKIAFAFDDDTAVDECHAAFLAFIKSARTREREQRDEHRAHCLCELESFLFGVALGKPSFPPLQRISQLDEGMPLPLPLAPVMEPPPRPPLPPDSVRHFHLGGSRWPQPPRVTADGSPTHHIEWQTQAPLIESISQRSKASDGTSEGYVYPSTRASARFHERYPSDTESRHRRDIPPPRRPSPQLTGTSSMQSDPQPRSSALPTFSDSRFGRQHATSAGVHATLEETHMGYTK